MSMCRFGFRIDAPSGARERNVRQRQQQQQQQTSITRCRIRSVTERPDSLIDIWHTTRDCRQDDMLHSQKKTNSHIKTSILQTLPVLRLSNYNYFIYL